MPISDAYRPAPRHASLGPAFFDPVRPAAFPDSVIRFRNDRAAETVGLADLSDAEWIRHFGRFEPLPGNLPEPLALRYHGHQFRTYNPDLGDGRGFLFAQMREAGSDRLLDLSTKGSGQTPWSRTADGRLTLKGGVREVLATEMLEAQGVRTSRSFSLIETGEALERQDEPSPTRSAVLTRLSHSHVRFGSFQRFAALNEPENIRKLLDYSIETYFPAVADEADPVAAFFDAVQAEIARLGGEWTAAGFVHGVLNTDNVVITGESFDYGPWRWLPTFDPSFTAAYFDQTGLYAFGRQLDALGWNLARLAECLLPFTQVDRLQAALDRFFEEATREVARATHRRLHLKVESDDAAIERGAMDKGAMARNTALFGAMRATEPPYERVFFDLMGGARPDRLAASPLAPLYRDEDWAEALAGLREAEPAETAEAALESDYAQRAAPVTMLVDEVEAIWEPIAKRDDWTALEAKIAEIRAAAPWMSGRGPRHPDA
ncbi:MAG: YdiU family protein, partial [Pseudomonadota bacterium]